MPTDNQAPKTSLEAAALIISGGDTTDIEKATHYAAGNPFDLDKLQEAHLRRMMGVDWGVTLTDKDMTVFTKEHPYVTKTVEYDGELNEETIELLVDTCLAVKEEYEAEKAKEEEDEQ